MSLKFSAAPRATLPLAGDEEMGATQSSGDVQIQTQDIQDMSNIAYDGPQSTTVGAHTSPIQGHANVSNFSTGVTDLQQLTLTNGLICIPFVVPPAENRSVLSITVTHTDGSTTAATHLRVVIWDANGNLLDNSVDQNITGVSALENTTITYTPTVDVTRSFIIGLAAHDGSAYQATSLNAGPPTGCFGYKGGNKYTVQGGGGLSNTSEAILYAIANATPATAAPDPLISSNMIPLNTYVSVPVIGITYEV